MHTISLRRRAAVALTLMLGSLNAGASATVTVRGTVPPLTRGSTFNGTFSAASANPDPNINNNSVTATTTVR